MLEHLGNALVVFLVVIDPVGMSAIFISLTAHGDRDYRRRMAVRGTGLAAGILLVFFFVGDWLLRALGITVPAFRIAGGALLFMLAIDMIFARQSGLRSTTAREKQEAAAKHDISVFPLAFPLIAGPGAFTSVLLMAPPSGEPLLRLAVLGVLLSVLGMALMALLFAEQVRRLLGETGTNVVSRVLGLVLAALAVQYVIDGLKGAFPPLQ